MMRSLVCLLCLVTLATSKPLTILTPAGATYELNDPFAVASSGLTLAVPAGSVAYREIMPQAPGISTVTEFQGVPFYPVPLPMVSNGFYY
ncbi:Roco2, Roco family protein [Anopheles sinensis]|uniref:Roco2, Roco family protein n=1 Tax=Anopheles sinensis TaxID=74873 RepID=A0A084WEB4_ANOSI|nr:Roco2, Roco family protein [Anopheles sinensis]